MCVWAVSGLGRGVGGVCRAFVACDEAVFINTVLFINRRIHLLMKLSHFVLFCLGRGILFGGVLVGWEF